MTDKLSEQIREVLLLDEKRTQGGWHKDGLDIYLGDGGWARSISPTPDCDESVNHTDADAAFIAAAPKTASLLRECLVRLEAAEKDAGRYQWLNDKNNSLERRQLDKGIDNGTSCYHIVGDVRELKHGDELNAAIDAAILNNREQKA